MLVFNNLLKVYQNGYLFFLALGPRSHMSALGLQPLGASTPQILSLQFQGIGWYDWDEVLKFSTKMYLKNTTYIINRRIFPIFFVRGTFST